MIFGGAFSRASVDQSPHTNPLGLTPGAATICENRRAQYAGAGPFVPDRPGSRSLSPRVVGGARIETFLTIYELKHSKAKIESCTTTRA